MQSAEDITANDFYAPGKLSPSKQAAGSKDKVEQGTGMSPEKGKGIYAHPHGGGRAEDEYLYKRYEHYGSEYDETEGEEDIYGSRAQFVAIDHDFTPKLVFFFVFSAIFL